MQSRRTYGQFCALARALDHVGDRWTLLIVRELLLGPATFRALRHALPGLGPGLLSERLQLLTEDGLVGRNDAPIRSKNVKFELTPAGAGLEPAVLELIRWGATWMASGPADDQVDPRWAVLALRALLQGPVAGRRPEGTIHIDTQGVWITIELREGHREVRPGARGTADATFSSSMEGLLAVAAGFRSTDRLAHPIAGEISLVRAALAPATRR